MPPKSLGYKIKGLQIEFNKINISNIGNTYISKFYTF